MIKIIQCPVCWGKKVICVGIKDKLKPILGPCSGCDGTGWLAYKTKEKKKMVAMMIEKCPRCGHEFSSDETKRCWLCHSLICPKCSRCLCFKGEGKHIMAKFYVAGKWEDRGAVRKLQEALIKLGHMITVDWTWHEKADEGYPIGYSIDDIKGVQLADAYVGLFVEDYRYKGALVEMGVALGLDKKVYLIGHAIDSCLFAKHPLVKQFDNEDEFLKYI